MLIISHPAEVGGVTTDGRGRRKWVWQIVVVVESYKLMHKNAIVRSVGG